MSKKCIKCGAELHDDASFCHACESVQTQRRMFTVPHRRKKYVYILLPVLLLIAAAVWFLWADGGEQNMQQAGNEPAAQVSPVLQVPDSPLTPKPPQEEKVEPLQEEKTKPTIEYLSGHQANYSADGNTFRVFATFLDEDSGDDGDDYFTTQIGQSEGYYKRVFIDAVHADTGEPAEEEFYGYIQTAHLEVLHAESGTQIAMLSPERCQDVDAVLDADVGFQSDSGKMELVWLITLRGGSELTFLQTMEIFPKEQLVYTPEDTPMDTMEDLRVLISRIETEVAPETEVIVHLPAVRYEGTLELNRAFSFYGSGNGSRKTTFTDTVYCRAPESNIICFFEIAFEGNGTGTGIEDHCGVFLGGCTLRNWEIAAKTGETGWVVPAGCNFEENEIGLQYNCRRFWFNNHEFIDDYFVSNKIAIEINRMPQVQALVFPGSHFVGNGEVLVNHVGQPVDLSSAEDLTDT